MVDQVELRWQLIKTFDALPSRQRPQYAAFYYPLEQSGRTPLAPTIQFSRNFGRRTCTHWMALPDPPHPNNTGEV